MSEQFLGDKLYFIQAVQRLDRRHMGALNAKACVKV
jgi:hypothetical protein